jgi:NhaP-type Na+/H+ and K+/H+ antiporter
MYYAMAVAFNASTNEISFLALHLPTRETKLVSGQFNSNKILLNKFVPDIEIKDMTVLAQLFADGNLLDQPPSTTINLERSVKKLMTRVKRVTPEEHRRQQQLHEKYHQQRESESRDL